MRVCGCGCASRLCVFVGVHGVCGCFWGAFLTIILAFFECCVVGVRTAGRGIGANDAHSLGECSAAMWRRMCGALVGFGRGARRVWVLTNRISTIFYTFFDFPSTPCAMHARMWVRLHAKFHRRHNALFKIKMKSVENSWKYWWYSEKSKNVQNLTIHPILGLFALMILP